MEYIGRKGSALRLAAYVGPLTYNTVGDTSLTLISGAFYLIALQNLWPLYSVI